MEVVDDLTVLDAVAKTISREIIFQGIVQVNIRGILIKVWQVCQIVIVSAKTLG